MTEHIGLREAVAIIDDSPNNFLEPDPRVLQFIKDVDDAGTQILSRQDDGFVDDVVTFALANATSSLLLKVKNMAEIPFILSLVDNPLFVGMIKDVVSISIGIAAVEELH